MRVVSEVSPTRYVTEAEYLRDEMDRDWRFEWVAGVAYAMSGASIDHNLAKDNISRVLGSLPAGDRCRVTTSDTKVRAPEAIYYPDVVIACAPRSGDGYVEDHPCAIVEVLSRSTRRIDRREKLAAYRKIDSLQDYLVVSVPTRRVDWHHRGIAGWEVTSVIGAGDITIGCLEGSISLAEIYRNVTEPDGPDPTDYLYADDQRADELGER